MIHADLQAQPVRFLVALHGSLLRQAAALVAQAAHIEAVVAARYGALPPREATDCRASFAHAHADLLDVLIVEDGTRIPQPITQQLQHPHP